MATSLSDKKTKILILGGYGSAGLPLARLLLQALPNVLLVLAGRHIEKAKEAADSLNSSTGGMCRVQGIYADASEKSSLSEAVRGCDLVVVASSTSQYVSLVASTAIEHKVDYFDLQYSTSKLRILQSMEDEIKEAGLCFVTEGGFHPGLPSAMVRQVATKLDSLEVANIGSVIAIDWASLDLTDSTLLEFIDEFKDFQCEYYKDGEWKDPGAWGMMNPKTIDFGERFGRRQCIPMFLEELRLLPTLYPSLKETGFFVGGFNWFVDWVLSPLIWAWISLFPNAGRRRIAKMFHWGVTTFSAPPYDEQC